MNDTTPADLAKFIHPVPVGATIPTDVTRVARKRTGALGWSDPFNYGIPTPVHSADEGVFFTAEPIAPPRPPLPTEGYIEAWGKPPFSTDEIHLVIAMLDRDGGWYGLTRDGSSDFLTPNQITRWRAVTVAPVDPTAPKADNGLRERLEALAERFDHGRGTLHCRFVANQLREALITDSSAS